MVRKPSPAAAAAPSEVRESTSDHSAAALATSGPAAVLVALLSLSGAIAAVAKFPNQPVPASLVSRIDIAQLALTQAIEGLLSGGFDIGGAPMTVDETGHGPWAADMGALHEAIQDRFAADVTATEARETAFTERLDAFEKAAAAAAQEHAQQVSDQLKAFEDRLKPAHPSDTGD